ncbi:hypothetical protein SAMN05216232_3920 [Virgibacillus subterraneus]|uniref:WYL domain-containing protein n=1 Tax=Virgibacillus subterraneus TaxID=621109 RepID=A0A1H9KLU4_9BACI|nr:hypothetical protein [Virgibacillus subterraneus]SER00062.1 hypothetical protein SAMN05216232_3920 [Virgibacillus subterraneus]
MKNMLQRSVQTKQNLEMINLDNYNQVSQRVVRVIKINDGLVLAYCFTRMKVRTFKLGDILSVEPVRKRMGA